MSKDRPNLDFGDELEGFDPKTWKPRSSALPANETTHETSRKAAAVAGFKSREPDGQSNSTPRPQQRRRRTGRNAQFNIKARPETIEAFCAVADEQGWGLGETLEYAVELLDREYGNKIKNP